MFVTRYLRSPFALRVCFSASISSNLALTDTRWRRRPRLFPETPSPTAAHGLPFRVRAGAVLAVLVNPVSQSLLIHPDLPGGRRDRSRLFDHHPSDLFLVFRSE